jgi:peptide/nickel transport system substrate-binding protein
MRRTTSRSVRAAALLGATAVALAGCAESDRGEPRGEGAASEGASGEGAAGGGGTFVFAASSDPVSLDPAFASDGETFRVARQIFEGLVGTEPGTADPAPLLATEWETSEDGLSTTFTLRDDVVFHDGEQFNAEAVCANFDRWYNWTGLLQSENLSYYYGKLFRGFADSDPKGIYESCTADDETTATITLTEPFAGFVPAMSLPAFSMQSPAAMEQYDADNVGGTEDDVRFSEYATAHPTGTGPFTFDKWDRGQQVTLAPFEDYWGEKAKLDQVVIRTIDDGNARRQALINGEIDGYDLVAPGDLEGLEADGFQIEKRDPFNILYLAFNQAVPELKDLKVRQAIAHAIDKEAVVSQSLPEGSEIAVTFQPEAVAGYTEDVTTYEYDPEKAKALLAEAGQSDLTIDFNYPTGVSRPYMPSPEDTFVAIRSQLEAVGITVNPVADQWSPNYLDKVTGSPDHGIHLLGWTGDYNDTDNFLGVFFGQATDEWGFDNPELFSALTEARGVATREDQTPLYEEINKTVMEFLPGVPIAHPVPSLAFAPEVEGYQASPVQDEVWNTVTVGEE